MLRRAAALTALLIALVPAAARADKSANVQVVAALPEMATAISANFIGDVMYVSTATGVFAYSVADPASPQLLSALPMYIWENEDVDVDRVRGLLFISRDPRGFTTPASSGATFPYGAVHIIDVSNPHAMVPVNTFLVPAGHTTTCINRCDFVWTSGPYANPQTNPGFVGRPIYATDVTDPSEPKPCPEPIATGHNDGVTDYIHDVQVDGAGIAWVSGVGGVRGYWTNGRHLNPVTGQTEEATGCKPIPYAGSGTPDKATPSRFMHNAWRDATPADLEPAPPVVAPPAPAAKKPASKAKKKKAKSKPRSRCRQRSKRARAKCKRAEARRRAAAKRRAAARRRAAAKKKRSSSNSRQAAPLRRADVLLGTEEELSTSCAASGRFVTYDLRGTYEGQGFKDTKTSKHRMTVLDTWTPEKQEGASGCASAHYFTTRADGISANSFYEQGVRFLDTSDPSNIRQVGFYREDDSNVFSTYWRGDGYVIVTDFTRGVEILRFGGSTSSPTVRARPRTAPRVTGGLRFSREAFGGLCPLKPPAA